MRRVGARIASGVIGAWIYMSAFLWKHTFAHFMNAWVLGVVAMMTAAAAYLDPRFRRVNTAIGVWMVASAFLLPHAAMATVWSNVASGAALALVSFLPGMADLSDAEPVGFLS